jgi:hypothetical protein
VLQRRFGVVDAIMKKIATNIMPLAATAAGTTGTWRHALGRFDPGINTWLAAVVAIFSVSVTLVVVVLRFAAIVVPPPENEQVGISVSPDFAPATAQDTFTVPVKPPEPATVTEVVAACPGDVIVAFVGLALTL